MVNRWTSRGLRTLWLSLLALAALLAALWAWAIAPKPYALSAQALDARYDHRASGSGGLAGSDGSARFPRGDGVDADAESTRAPAPQASARTAAPAVTPMHLQAPQRVQIGQTPAWAVDLRFASFDGAVATGRIVYPFDPRTADRPGSDASEPPAHRRTAAPRPVLLALHGLGRTQWRWWQAEFKGRPTIEHTHHLAEQALRQGLVVIALDARGHGDRKDPERPLISWQLLARLHLLGEREPYERLIVDTVRDYRVLLDWITAQPGLDAQRIAAAGYSMGAQMALLLAGVDARVGRVAAMVPPAVGDTVAVASPQRVADRLGCTPVWLLSADDDAHATVAENAALFAALQGVGKRHLRYDSGHALPAAYVDDLRDWLAAAAASVSIPTAQRSVRLNSASVRAQACAAASG